MKNILTKFKHILGQITLVGLTLQVHIAKTNAQGFPQQYIREHSNFDRFGIGPGHRSTGGNLTLTGAYIYVYNHHIIQSGDVISLFRKRK